LVAAAASLVTLIVFAVVAIAVFRDNGWLTASEPISARVAQGHDDAERLPLRNSEHARTEAPNERIASAHSTAMQSPWQKFTHDITSAILPNYRVGRRDDGAVGAKTRLVEFDSAPFPYDGAVTASRVAYAAEDDEETRGAARGRLFRQKNAYSDRRVLLHIPKTFDPRRPGTIVVFFHGHRATLTRDVLQRQKVAEQISASGVNAVLVAPQFAVAASDSSPGHLGEPGGFKRFLDEAARKLASVHGDAAAARAFANMPVVLVAYSGGYLAAAWSLHHGGVSHRVRGLVLLDALYGDVDKFAAWIAENRNATFVSAYMGRTTRRKNVELMQMLDERGVSYVTEMPAGGRRDNVIFLPTSGTRHNDYVTNAWAALPIKDLLQRHAGRLVGGGAVARTSGSGSVR